MWLAKQKILGQATNKDPLSINSSSALGWNHDFKTMYAEFFSGDFFLARMWRDSSGRRLY